MDEQKVKNISKNVAALLEEKGISPKELASIMGVKKGAIEDILGGNMAWIRSKTIQKLCQALDCSYEDLIKD